MEKAYCGEQLHRGQQECDSNNRHGDEYQGGGTAECERISEVYAIRGSKADAGRQAGSSASRPVVMDATSS
eukprot:7736532-Heterocapsa_arctica.AAC.1